MAQKEKVNGVESLGTFYASLLRDLPVAGARWGLGTGEQREVAEAAWNGYDAGVRLASAATDNLYRNPFFGDVLARSVEGFLRWQRVRNAVAGAFFTGLWRTVGLPSRDETEALREEVRALRDELRSVGARVAASKKETPAEIRRADRGVFPVAA